MNDISIYLSLLSLSLFYSLLSSFPHSVSIRSISRISLCVISICDHYLFFSVLLHIPKRNTIMDVLQVKWCECELNEKTWGVNRMVMK